MIRRVLSADADETYIDEYRINAVVSAVKRRIQNLELFIREQRNNAFVSGTASTEDDVLENIAEDYTRKTTL